MNEGGAFVPLEGIHSEDYVIATYLIGTERDVDIFKYAQGIAFEQTTGTWVRVPWETEDLRETHGGKVVGIYEVPAHECTIPKGMEERQFIVRLAYPVINLGSNFPLLLTTVAGEISSHGRIKLLDLEFPKRYAEMYKGPRFGIDGVRKILGVFDRPLLLNMIKPCTGFSPEVGAKLLYEVGKGGADIIKDDELIVDPPFCPLKVRVKKYMEQCKRIYEEIGRVVLYTPNITDRPDKILDHAREAIDAGAKGLMISYLPAGFSSIQVLVESRDIQVPLLGHSGFSGLLYESPSSGMSSALLQGKLPRLLGLDMVLVLNPYAQFPVLRDQYLKICRLLQAPFFDLKPGFPMIGGGVHPGRVTEIINDIGKDCIIGAGGAIHGHPLGPMAGAKAFSQALEATRSGMKLEEAATRCEELRIALSTWK